MITLKDFSSLNLSRAQSKEEPEHSEGHQENKTEPKNKMITINLPTDVLFKIFQFHQPTWELNKNFALYREISKKNKIKALRDEMNVAVFCHNALLPSSAVQIILNGASYSCVRQFWREERMHLANFPKHIIRKPSFQILSSHRHAPPDFFRFSFFGP